MKFWLIKTEPHVWSWDDQLSQGTTHWDGVRNYQARNSLKAMAVNDRAFFYHSGNERRIMGIVKVTKPYYPDPSDPSGKFGMVNVDTLQSFPQPVSLAQIKAIPALQNLPLIRQSRLSVMPLSQEAWDIILNLSENEAL